MTEETEQFESSPETSQIGKILDSKYELKEVLGKGAFGTVYSAKHLILNSPVAIKVLNQEVSSEEKWQERFMTEARILMQLEHPNIVRVLSSGVATGNEPYIVMDLISGKTLKKLLTEEHKFTAGQTASLAAQLFGALSYAHGKGAVHRDISPANILVQIPSEQNAGETTRDPQARSGGQSLQLKLFDFGLAKIISVDTGNKETQTRALLGTAQYMSPEQCRAQSAGKESDIYSAACVIFECFAGRTLFAGNSDFEIMHKHLYEKPSFRSEDKIPDSLSKPLLCCLEKDPNLRSYDALQMEQLFAQYGRSSDEPENSGAFRFSRTSTILAASIVLLSLALGFAFFRTREAAQKNGKNVSGEQAKGNSSGNKPSAIGTLSLDTLLSKAAACRSFKNGYKRDLAEALRTNKELCRRLHKELRSAQSNPERKETLELMLIDSLCGLALVYENEENFSLAFDTLKEAMQEAHRSENPEQVLKVQIALLDYWISTGNLKRALSEYENSKVEFDSNLLSKLNSSGARAAAGLENWDKTIRYARLTLKSRSDSALLKYNPIEGVRPFVDQYVFANLELLATGLLRSSRAADKQELKDILKRIRDAADVDKGHFDWLEGILEDLSKAKNYELLVPFARGLARSEHNESVYVKAVAFTKLQEAAAACGDFTQADALGEEASEVIPEYKYTARAKLKMSNAFVLSQSRKHADAKVQAVSALRIIRSNKKPDDHWSRPELEMLMDACKYAASDNDKVLEAELLREFIRESKLGLLLLKQRVLRAESFCRLAQIEKENGNWQECAKAAKEGLLLASLFREQEAAIFSRLDALNKEAGPHLPYSQAGQAK